MTFENIRKLRRSFEDQLRKDLNKLEEIGTEEAYKVAKQLLTHLEKVTHKLVDPYYFLQSCRSFLKEKKEGKDVETSGKHRRDHRKSKRKTQ